DYGFKRRWFGHNFPIVAIVVQVVGTGFEHDVHKIVLTCGTLRNDDVALLVKQVRDGAGRSHVAPVFTKRVANFADSAVAVISVDVEQNGDTAGAVALKRKLLKVDAGQFAGATLDGALDVVLRHVFRLGRENSSAYASIALDPCRRSLNKANQNSHPLHKSGACDRAITHKSETVNTVRK